MFAHDPRFDRAHAANPRDGELASVGEGPGDSALRNLSLSQASRNLESLSSAQVENARCLDGAVRPLYEGLCFSSLPGFVESLLVRSTGRTNFPRAVTSNLGTFDHVVFMFLDAFGWESFLRFRETADALKLFDSHGAVAQTTAQFPSTTAAHVTTMMTGTPAYTHGVCGWDYYEPRVGRMITPLKLSDPTSADKRSLLSLGYAPDDILPRGSFYRSLQEQGVQVSLFGPAAFFPSMYSRPYVDDSSVYGYRSVAEGFELVRKSLETEVARSSPSFHYLYVDEYDSICHKHGVGAQSSDSVARDILAEVYRFQQHARFSKTLFILSADHGQISQVNGGALKLQELMPDIGEYLKTSPTGELIRFSGGARHLFLHGKDDAVEYVRSTLKRKLDGAATVLTIPELSELGFLGPQSPSTEYLERLGNIAILPRAGYAVSWFEPPIFTEPTFSSHGGISPQEMETPLLLLRLS